VRLERFGYNLSGHLQTKNDLDTIRTNIFLPYRGEDLSREVKRLSDLINKTSNSK